MEISLRPKFALCVLSSFHNMCHTLSPPQNFSMQNFLRSTAVLIRIVFVVLKLCIFNSTQLNHRMPVSNSLQRR